MAAAGRRITNACLASDAAPSVCLVGKVLHLLPLTGKAVRGSVTELTHEKLAADPLALLRVVPAVLATPELADIVLLVLEVRISRGWCRVVLCWCFLTLCWSVPC